MAEMSDAKETVEVRSDVTTGRLLISDPDMGEKINHHLKRGFRLLHVGQGTARGSNDEPWQRTVAVLGK